LTILSPRVQAIVTKQVGRGVGSFLFIYPLLRFSEDPQILSERTGLHAGRSWSNIGCKMAGRPRIVIGALKGGAGKTVLTLGLVAAWRNRGLQVAPFKKGPDFIDAAWLAFAAGRPCYNLDPFLMNQEQITNSFFTRSSQAHLSVIEGNRGLYDGVDLEGGCSTAEVAKFVKAPLLIVVDVSMTTRTVAALVRGCQVFDPALNIRGVVLNRVAGLRQENLIRRSIEKYCGLEVVGSVPKMKNIFPERHMGLVPHQERKYVEEAIAWTSRMVEEHLRLDRIREIAFTAEGLDEVPETGDPGFGRVQARNVPRVGYIRDQSFWFYYPENLEQLQRLGAVLVEIDATSDKEIPELDALYIGGGFPETQAEVLSNNRSFRSSLRERIEDGLPVYAECGGFMYLGEHLLVDRRKYPMVGALPVDFILEEKPQGHGYTVLQVEKTNPFYRTGQIFKGHEFHYSKPVIRAEDDVRFVFRAVRGHGIKAGWDGMCRKNLVATFTHVHSVGFPLWGESLVRAAVKYRGGERKNFLSS